MSEDVIAGFPPESATCWREFPNGLKVHHTAVIGHQPVATAANRRKVTRHGTTNIGRNGVVHAFSVIYAGVTVGEDACVGDHSIIREGTMIGDRCVIGAMVDIQYNAMIENDVRILNAAHIAGGCVIGEGSFIGPGVRMANDRHIDLADYQDRGTRRAPVIGKRVMVGVGAVILPGVTIGDGAVIAAGAIVTKDVAAGVTVWGFAARERGQGQDTILGMLGDAGMLK